MPNKHFDDDHVLGSIRWYLHCATEACSMLVSSSAYHACMYLKKNHATDDINFIDQSQYIANLYPKNVHIPPRTD